MVKCNGKLPLRGGNVFNILSIEDNIYQRESLVAMINELGKDYKIFEADCEEEALKLAMVKYN